MYLDPSDVGLGALPLLFLNVVLSDPDVHVASRPARLVKAVRRGEDVLSEWGGITYWRGQCVSKSRKTAAMAFFWGTIFSE